MKNEIALILREYPGLKGREIAKLLAREKSEVNSFLSRNTDVFFQDTSFCWFNKDASEMRIHLDKNTWLTGLMFDQSVGRSGSPLESDSKLIHIFVPEGCKIFLEAAARLLALSNQCIHKGKSVFIDFTESQGTLTYLDRVGFFDLLDRRVTIKPAMHSVSKALLYQGNSDAVYEFAEIKVADPDEKIPKRLKSCFVSLVEEALGQSGVGLPYSQPAFLVLSELFGNVRDHSDSPLSGYIALQRYKGFGGKNRVGPHIQTIVSDSGKGIVGTLRPILESKYPSILKALPQSVVDAGPMLVKMVFEKGQISQSPDEGRGLGLRRSAEVASDYNAKVSVREERFEVQMVFEEGKLAKFSYELNLPFMLGTHICFDFHLQTTH